MKNHRNGIWGTLFYAALVLALAVSLFYAAYAQEDCALPVLMYHEIVLGDEDLDDYTASTAQLEADLQALSEQGFETVFLSEVVAYVHDGTPLPPKPVLLVFDDGYRSVLSQVILLLEQYGAKAMVSVIGARAGH